ncbi:MAG: hypothetical protein H7A24_10305 [Leptospiraceae bacterium]|nr:hypothetical protein [Leptospiraceae bacterium]MCP5512262.1 hypothetical protein [Leptospiraceae bacterium]
MTVKKLYIVLIGLICIAIVFFMFSGEDEAKKNAKKKRNEQLSLLLGGGGSQPKENTGRGQRKTATSSVFDDGDFMKVGISDNYEEDSSESGDKGEIPINPQTGKPYDEETMEQFEKLSLVFPGNELIPKRITPQDKLDRENKAKEMTRIALAIQSNSANPSEISNYYESQEKVLQDRIEIIRYLVDLEKEDGPISSEQNIDFEKILKGAEEQLENLSNQKEQALSKVGN